MSSVEPIARPRGSEASLSSETALLLVLQPSSVALLSLLDVSSDSSANAELELELNSLAMFLESLSGSAVCFA